MYAEAEGKIKRTWASRRIPLSAHPLNATTPILSVGVDLIQDVQLTTLYATTFLRTPAISTLFSVGAFVP